MASNAGSGAAPSSNGENGASVGAGATGVGSGSGGAGTVATPPPTPPGASASQLVDKTHYPWADPNAVPRVPIVPTMMHGVYQPPPPEPFINWNKVTESCITRGALSGVAGFALGGAFGVLAGSYEAITPPAPLPGQPAPPSLPFRQALKDSVGKMKTKSRYWSKNFGIVGGVFTTVECVIEHQTGSHSLKHSVAAGCVTGAAIAAKQGPQAMCLGCVGFGIFSAVIDKVFDA